MKSDLHVLVKRAPWGGQVSMIARMVRDGGRFVAYAKFVFEERENDEQGPRSEEQIQLDQTTSQRLMDSLWDAGLRPTEGSGSAGSMLATQKHLEDMRSLVFQRPVVVNMEALKPL